MLAETAPLRNRGFYTSWQSTSQAAGFLLGAVVTLIVTLSTTPEQIEAAAAPFTLPRDAGNTPCLVASLVGPSAESQLRVPRMELRPLLCSGGPWCKWLLPSSKFISPDALHMIRSAGTGTVILIASAA